MPTATHDPTPSRRAMLTGAAATDGRPWTGTEPRFLPVRDDTLEPQLRQGDFVAVVAVDGYQGEGCYAVWTEFGTVEFVTVQGVGRPDTLFVARANPAYGPGHMASLEWFSEAVLGKVAAHCRVLDHALLSGRA